MQIPKFSLWICALALCGGMTLRADDTPAQAAARAALLQHLQELQGNPTPAPQTPPPAATAPAAPVVPAPSSPPPAPAMAAAPVNPATGDTPAQAEARAALMQHLQELQGNPVPAPQTPPPVAAAPAAPAPNPPPSAPAPAMAAAPVNPVTGDTAAQAEARAALAQKMADLGITTSQPTAITATAPTATTAPAATKNSATTLQRIPMIAPALPISATKEEKLRVLLARYEADLISPEQYHEQRAAILAAP